MFTKRIGIGALFVLTGGAALAAPLPEDKLIPNYDHILVIVEENKSIEQVTSQSTAPNLARLAKEYGLASQFYAEVHPSEANYIAMVGGSTFGIHDDDAFYCVPGQVDKYCKHAKDDGYVDHTIRSKSLVDQLKEHGLGWKGYYEDLAEPGSKAILNPEVDDPATGRPAALYASKHTAFINFASVQSDPDLAKKLVDFRQLEADLKSGDLPAYAQIVPNQCNEMHGLGSPLAPPDCRKDAPGLIARGDAEVGRLVSLIQASPAWSAAGNMAIVITFDEGGADANDKHDVRFCCGSDPNSAANYGGGQISTIVITNHGPRGVVDDTPYNHYSLLRTVEDAFGIDEHLNYADATDAGVRPMLKLFATKKAPAR